MSGQLHPKGAIVAQKRNTRAAAKRRIDKIEKALQAWELRSRGATLREIAELVGVASPTTAQALVEDGFREFYAPQVEQRRAEADARHHSAFVELSHVAFAPRTGAGSPTKGERVAALAELRKWDRENRMLHGLDAPARQQVSVVSDEVSPERAAQIARELFGDHAARALDQDPPGDAGDDPVAPPAGE